VCSGLFKAHEAPFAKNLCCYIKVDSAMAALQKGFSPYKFSFVKKTQYYSENYKQILILKN
jgi:hypothetical protein